MNSRTFSGGLPLTFLLPVVTILVLSGLLCAWSDRTDASPRQGPRDNELFGAVVNRVHAGESYYDVMGEELRTRGYQTSSIFNWRLPTLTWLEAALPSVRWSVGALTLIGLATFVLWLWPFRALFAPRVILMAIALLSAMPAWAWVDAPSIVLHDLWTGQLIALSLACRFRGWTKSSLAVGAVAISIRELALPFVVLMAGLAWLEKRRGESLAWCGVAALFAAWLGWHALHVWPRAGHEPLPGWLALGGWCFVLVTSRVNLLWMLSSGWVVALIVPVLLGGLWNWPGAGSRRVAAVTTAYLAMFTVVGRPDNWYWGLLTAPLLPLGVIGWLAPRAGRAP